MKKPKDPRPHLKVPSPTIEVEGSITVKPNLKDIVHAAYNNIPDGVAHSNVRVETIGIYTTSSVRLSWVRVLPNPDYEKQVAEYQAVIAKYEEDLKKFELYQKDKIIKDKEGLDDEIARLERRLNLLKEQRANAETVSYGAPGIKTI